MADSTRDMFLALSVDSMVKKNKTVPVQSQDVAIDELGNRPALRMDNVLKNCFDSDVLKPIPNS